jgi:hypothetical protein
MPTLVKAGLMRPATYNAACSMSMTAHMSARSITRNICTTVPIDTMYVIILDMLLCWWAAKQRAACGVLALPVASSTVVILFPFENSLDDIELIKSDKII